MENKFDYQKGIEENHEKLTQNKKQTNAETKKSILDTNVFKVAVGKIYDFNVSLEQCFGYACIALRKNSLLADVLRYYYIDSTNYISKYSELVVTIKIQPFYKGKKDELYERSGLHQECVFVFSLLSHFG